MVKISKMADLIQDQLFEIENIANCLRDATQYQSDNNPDVSYLLAVANILCKKLNDISENFDDFIYKIPIDL